MYKKCAYCARLGEDCEGANLISLDSSELMEFCKLRKKHLGWSNAELAKKSGVPKGTIDRLFSGNHPDYKYETIRQLVRAFVGVEFFEAYCPEEDAAPDDTHHIIRIEHQQETIERLEEDKSKLQHDRMRMREYIADSTSAANEQIDNLQKHIAFLNKQLKARNWAFLLLCLVFFAIILTIVIVLK